MSLLIKEPPLQVLPSLAVRIGLYEAIVVQQLHYFLGMECGREIDGKRWIFNTYEEWQKIFPFWTARIIERIFNQLETMQLVISCQPEGRQSRRKYYRLNEGMVKLMESERIPEAPNLVPSEDNIFPEAPNLVGSGSPEFGAMEAPNLVGSLKTETTTKNPETTFCLNGSAPKKKPRRGTVNGHKPEMSIVEDFTESIGLPRKDGEIAWLKWQARGWPKNWMDEIRYHKRAGWLHSQKQHWEPSKKRSDPLGAYFEEGNGAR